MKRLDGSGRGSGGLVEEREEAGSAREGPWRVSWVFTGSVGPPRCQGDGLLPCLQRR